MTNFGDYPCDGMNIISKGIKQHINTLQFMEIDFSSCYMKLSENQNQYNGFENLFLSFKALKNLKVLDINLNKGINIDEDNVNFIKLFLELFSNMDNIEELKLDIG